MDHNKEQDESTVIKAAKAIGKAAGKVAALAGVHPDASAAASKVQAKGKLPKKNKKRLPRRQKKAQQRSLGLHTR